MSEIQERMRAAEREGPRDRRSVGKQARGRLLATMPVKERRLKLAGISTAVLEGGHGAPLVLLHGPGEYAAKWMRVIPDLVTTHHVIAPDLPGHGASRTPNGLLETDQASAWLGELIDHTCPRPPVLVGAAPSPSASLLNIVIGSANWCLSTPSVWRRSSQRRSSGSL